MGDADIHHDSKYSTRVAKCWDTCLEIEQVH